MTTSLQFDKIASNKVSIHFTNDSKSEPKIVQSDIETIVSNVSSDINVVCRIPIRDNDIELVILYFTVHVNGLKIGFSITGVEIHTKTDVKVESKTRAIKTVHIDKTEINQNNGTFFEFEYVDGVAISTQFPGNHAASVKVKNGQSASNSVLTTFYFSHFSFVLGRDIHFQIRDNKLILTKVCMDIKSVSWSPKSYLSTNDEF